MPNVTIVCAVHRQITDVEVHVISSIPWNFLMNFCEMTKENFEMLKEIVV